MNSDNELDPAISSLYQSRPKATPAAEIDAAILAQAQEAIANRAAAPKELKQTWQRWWVPLSTAALVVMGVSVTIKIMNQPEPVYLAPSPAMERSIEMQGDIQQPLKKEQQEQPERSQRPAPAQRKLEAEMEAAPVVQDAATLQEKKASAPKARRRSSEEELDEQTQLERASPATNLMGFAPDSDQLDRDDTELTGVDAAGAQQLEWSTPEAWLNHISQLLQNKQQEEVRAELERFRLDYPDYPLPEELQQMLE